MRWRMRGLVFKNSALKSSLSWMWNSALSLYSYSLRFSSDSSSARAWSTICLNSS
jgi:hypothetical protein